GLLKSTAFSADFADSQMDATMPPLSDVSVARIEHFCGDCHPLPLATSFPKANWGEEVRQGFDFYFETDRIDLEEPTQQEVVQYYQADAPDKVIVPRADAMTEEPSPIRFEAIHGLGNSGTPAATAQVLWDASTRSVLFTDMLNGTLRSWGPGPQWPSNRSDVRESLLGTGKNICRTFPFDWDQDGLQDFLVGELGSFPVGDHQNGGVGLIFGSPDGNLPSLRIAEGLGRTIEAKPFDYDSDGDNDLLVADFGWRETGSLRLLRNIGGSSQKPEFKLETLDNRHGVLGVEVADLDGDSLLDFAVAYGQEFETVEVFYNQGKETFDHRVILQLPDPSYNVSSLQIVDLDQDGQLDIVYTCGDTMDTMLAKPFHGLRWARNLGDRNWEDRDLGLLVGALQSTVADFDNDGDYDIAAIGLYPKGPNDPGAFDSICWWEQKAELNFERHSIERDNCTHATCSSGDVNGDGRIDLIVGDWFASDNSAFSVFLNQPAAVVLPADDP
ncbi:MAG: VCBS repeat-containing protein, partial [Aureliella sp.]